MNLTIDKYLGANLLLAEGTLDDSSFKELIAQVDSFPVDAEKNIFLGCADIKSLLQRRTCFSGFVSNLLYLRSRNAKITLFGYDQQVYDLFELLKIKDLFHFAPTLDEAYIQLSQELKENQDTESSSVLA